MVGIEVKNQIYIRNTASGLRFTTYDYDSVLGKYFAHARMYDPSLGRMLGAVTDCRRKRLQCQKGMGSGSERRNRRGRTPHHDK